MRYSPPTSVILALACSFTAPAAGAGTLLDEKGEFGPAPEDFQKSYTLAQPSPVRLGVQLAANLEQGSLTLRILDASNSVLLQQTTTTMPTQVSHVVDAPAGSLTVELSGSECVGPCQLYVVELPERAAYYPMLATGPLMILVGLGFVLVWLKWSQTQIRWFAIGAGIWALGVLLKVVWALALNGPILQALKDAAPRSVFITVGSVYVGLLTGIFEIGITLAIAWKWRQMAAAGNRAVAVGIGAGAIEAVLLGLAGLVQAVVLVAGVPGTQLVEVAVAYVGASTPLLWIAGPVERIIAILCHTSSRTLVLLAVARRRWSFFWYGFLLMTAIDAIAGWVWVHLSGELGRLSMWWIELALAPFAVVSVPIVIWCLRRWPSPGTPVEADLLPTPSSLE